MTADTAPHRRPTAAILAEAAQAAGHAPSIHNTQPWRWRASADGLDLYAERDRQLTVTDPESRLLHISCGAALHHVRAALAAEGWATAVQLLPDPTDPTHLARVTLGSPLPVTAEAMRLYQAIELRHTDRRPVSAMPVLPAAVAALRTAAAAEGAQLHLLTSDQVLDLAAAADTAQRVETTDADWREELAYWAGGLSPAGTGVPANAIPAEPTQTTVPSRDFGHPGTLPVSAEHDRHARYAILYGDADDPAGWLIGGQALSHAWLVATEQGLTLLPFSAVIEVDRTRAALRTLLSGIGHPYLVLRLGISDPDHAGPPHTPRLPAEQVIEY